MQSHPTVLSSSSSYSPRRAGSATPPATVCPRSRRRRIPYRNHLRMMNRSRHRPTCFTPKSTIRSMDSFGFMNRPGDPTNCKMKIETTGGIKPSSGAGGAYEADLRCRRCRRAATQRISAIGTARACIGSCAGSSVGGVASGLGGGDGTWGGGGGGDGFRGRARTEARMPQAKAVAAATQTRLLPS
jgi:hypothetical protein